MIVDNIVIVLIYVLIIVIAICVAFIIDPGSYDSTRWYAFIATVAAMSFIMVFFSNIATVESRQDGCRRAHIERMETISDNMMSSSITAIHDSKNVIPRFTASLFPLTCSIDNIPEIGEGHTEFDAQIHKISLSMKLFSTWERFIISRNYCKTKKYSYTRYFLQWASSPYLKEMWEHMRVNYTRSTRIFGDNLFTYASEVKDHTCDEYKSCSNKLFSNKTIRNLFNNGH